LRHFVKAFRERWSTDRRPWLVIGKGPTFDRIGEVDLSRYLTLGLNQVAREMPLDVAHFIDWASWESCGEAIASNADFLLTVANPHVAEQPSPVSLRERVSGSGLLQALDADGRLLWYQHDLARLKGVGVPGGWPEVRVRYFSAEGAIGALALAGARTIRTIGVDGGRSYSAKFADCPQGNPHPYDRQFPEIEAVVRRSGIDFAPLFPQGKEG
jgi:hypothetical protein